jgi:hypothetical protein
MPAFHPPFPIRMSSPTFCHNPADRFHLQHPHLMKNTPFSPKPSTYTIFWQFFCIFEEEVLVPYFGKLFACLPLFLYFNCNKVGF